MRSLLPEGKLKGLIDILSLFAQRREIRADSAEGLGTVGGAKSTGDFLLELGYANVALGLVVVEKDLRTRQEPQHLVGVKV